jgi:serine/threonine protein kinase
MRRSLREETAPAPRPGRRARDLARPGRLDLAATTAHGGVESKRDSMHSLCMSQSRMDAANGGLPMPGASDTTEGPEANGVPDPAIPAQIGRYDIFEPLGFGAYGFVVRAFDPMLQQPCALKIPNLNVRAEPRKLERFLREARALARLDRPATHPNIVRVYDADNDGVICYIAMEYCALGSLADWLHHRPDGALVPVSWAADLVKQIAGGVQHAHDQGIYHRDLKPGNILLAPAPTSEAAESPLAELTPEFPRFCPKVGDFGLAKILDDEDQTMGSAVIGTRPYMAPEQIRGESAAIAPASDVWALGVILYELMVGRRPFEGPGDAAFRDQICNRDPVAPRSLRRDVPRGLEIVCLRCLEKSPRDRYQSPSELANDLKRVLENLDPLGRPAPSWKRVVRRVRRHPMRAAALTMLVLALAVAAALGEYVRRVEIEKLFQEVKAARIGDLPDLVPRLADLRDSTVADRLGVLFDNGKDVPQLAAALVLARQRSECAQFCCDRLLDARPEELGPITRVLNDRVSNLLSTLQGAVNRAPKLTGADKERFDRRRASAAAALAILGSDGPACELLRRSPDPQVRSFLIHDLGPSGVAPAVLVERLENPATGESVRAALIQSLDLIPEGSWDASLRTRVTSCLLDRYRNDPSAAVHGSAKWLLHRWSLDTKREQIDCELACSGQNPPGFQWRVCRAGLTLITLADLRLDHVIEVSDTEITVEMFQRFDQKVEYSPEISPTESCPVNGVSYYEAAAFCNWLTAQEGLRARDACYQTAGIDPEFHRPELMRVGGHLDRAGFRLPTSDEFAVFCPAGTTTRRYHGDSDFLFERYAWTFMNTDGETHPVAGLLPNDLGLFDTLGNVCEWCDAQQLGGPTGLLVADQLGGFSAWAPPRKLDRFVGAKGVKAGYRHPSQGLRVARTIRRRQTP